LLSTELVEELSKYNHARFQITLDGYGEDHNMTRVLANGRGSFRVVWNNIVNLKKSKLEFQITLRLHITTDNYSSMKKMIMEINKVIGKDTRFNVHFHNIVNLGGPNTDKIITLNKKKYLGILKEFTSLLKIKSDSEVSKKINKSICYAAKPNSLLIRADGRIGKCTVLLDNPLNDVGKFLPNGEIEINNNKLKPWMYGFNLPDSGILSCPAANGLKLYEKKHGEALLLNVV